MAKRPRRRRRIYRDPTGAWQWDGAAWRWYLDPRVRYERGRRWRVGGRYASPDDAMSAVLHSIAATAEPEWQEHVDAYRDGARWLLVLATVPDGLRAWTAMLSENLDEGDEIDFEIQDVESLLGYMRAWEADAVREPWFAWLSAGKLPLASAAAGAVLIYASSANVYEYGSPFAPMADGPTSLVGVSRAIRTMSRRLGDDIRWYGAQWTMALE